MTDDQWVKERAGQYAIARGWAASGRWFDEFCAFGQEAIERARSEERALAAEARAKMQARINEADKLLRRREDIICNRLVDLERASMRAALAEAKLARLRNPDEAMANIVAPRISKGRWSTLSDDQKASWREQAKPTIRAIAAHLDETTEKEPDNAKRD